MPFKIIKCNNVHEFKNMINIFFLIYICRKYKKHVTEYFLQLEALIDFHNYISIKIRHNFNLYSHAYGTTIKKEHHSK